ncbi:MAG: AAA family ATPase [Rhodococcus sp.]|uniref:AAA family ATPase n=1 Tax=Rhodococcus sp. TaxID=1831 RepID=UPI00169716B7|nr:AAA family ATPase [Rhodococcus sp. (in: high G+C Gram-positive bacteria)]NLV77776.1 AAA family ATPase [Rhodococcus sp. (in: high G+C Gram-positive bacteria)]
MVFHADPDDPFADVPPAPDPGDEHDEHDEHGEYREPRPHLRERLLSLSDLAKMPGVEPLVEGLLYRDTLAQLSGPPGSYKSFVTLGLACSVALGLNWEGHPVPQSGRVVYVAAEGASGLLARILAWCELSGVVPGDLDDRLFVLPAPIQLGNVVDVAEAIEVVRDLEAVLLVLDTRARCTIGLEENSATEQGRAIDQLERIQHAAACTVLAVHHSAKNSTGGRGSSVWDGAVWSDLRVTGEDLCVTLEVAKHKDAVSGIKHHYRLVPHTVSESLMPNASDEQRKSLVVVRRDPSDNLSDDRPSTRAVLDILRTSAGHEGLSRAEIRDLAAEQGVSKSTAYEAVNALLKKGALRNVGTDRRMKYVPTAAYLEGM